MGTLRTSLTWFASSLFVFMTLSSHAHAQPDHLVDRSALAAAVTAHVSQQDAHRAAIRKALDRPEARDVAAAVGLDLDRAIGTIATLGGAPLEQAAAHARQVNEALVGGQSTVTISTTTIIIALLIVILLVVAID